MTGTPMPGIYTTQPAVEGLADGGALFFTDLLQTDPTLISPVLVTTIHLLNIEVGTDILLLPYILISGLLNYTL